MYNLTLLQNQYEQIINSSNQKNLVLNEENITSIRRVIGDLFQQKISQLQNSIIKVFFIGAANSGKSTLINSIVGLPLLPTSNQNNQTTFITIEHHNDNFITTQVDEVEICSTNPVDLRKHIKEGVIKGVIRCKFKYSFDLNCVQLIDTPGFRQDDDVKNQNIIDGILDICKNPNVIPIFVLVINHLFDGEYKFIVELLQKITFHQNQSVESSFNSMFKELENDYTDNDIDVQQKNYIIVLNQFGQKEKQCVSRLGQEKVSLSKPVFRIQFLYTFYSQVFQDKESLFYSQLVKEFYFQHKTEYTLENEEQAKSFIEINILKNQKILKMQDFNQFLNQLNWDITYEFNRTQFNQIHHKLTANLCILDQIQQGIIPENNLEFLFNLSSLYEQIHHDYLILVNKTFYSYEQDCLNKRQNYYTNFILTLQNPNKHLLVKQLIKYYEETMNFLLECRKIFHQCYSEFINQKIGLLEGLLGPTASSFEVISLSNLNLIEQLKLIILQVEGILLVNLDMADLQQSIEQLPAKIGLTDSEKTCSNTIHALYTMMKKVSGRTNVIDIIQSTRDLIKNDQIVDLSIIQENVYFTERQVIRSILDVINTYSFTLQQIMRGCKTFIDSFS